MKKLDTTKKENKLGLLVLILSIVICIATISYAMWSNIYHGKKENVLKTGTLVLKLNEKSESISLLNTIPLSDRKGMEQEAYTFSLQNTGTADANYRLSIVDDDEYYNTDNCTNNKLDWKFLRYALTEDNTTPVIANLNEHSGVLKEGTIESNKEITFTLNIWINSSTTITEMGKHFHGKIKVDAIQSDQTLTE